MKYITAGLLMLACGSSSGTSLGVGVGVDNRTEKRVTVILQTVHSWCFYTDAPADCNPKRTKGPTEHILIVEPRSLGKILLGGMSGGTMVMWRVEPKGAVSRSSGELKTYANEALIILEPPP